MPTASLTSPTPATKSRVATVGTFDGMHRGHQAVLDTLKEQAAAHQAIPTVITFRQHPLTVIAPERAPKTLMPAEEKLRRLKAEGVEVMLMDFTPTMMAMTARDWMLHLRDELRVELIVLGYDNTFGSDGRKMTAADYTALGTELDMEVVVAPVVEGCSSSGARKAVAEGDMEKASEILGRPFSLTGTVAHGDRIGRTIGFPTANLELPDPGSQLLSPFGAYASWAELTDGRRLPAVTNIGIRPSVTDEPLLRIETHIPDFEADLYGQPLTILLVKMLRPERRFPDLAALQAAIEADKATALSLLKNSPSAPSP